MNLTVLSICFPLDQDLSQKPTQNFLSLTPNPVFWEEELFFEERPSTHFSGVATIK